MPDSPRTGEHRVNDRRDRGLTGSARDGANVPHVAKSEETRSLIVTTAYYSFSSEEQLIQGFYDEIARQHLDAARAASIGLLREVVDGSDVKLDPQLRARLPELLWLYQMGVVLYWVHDRSAGQRRSRLLAQRSVPLVARPAALSRLRVFRPVSREITDLVQEPAKRD
jgi:hypothetical protein